MDQCRPQQTISRDSSQDCSAQQPKFLNLTRCAGCYKQVKRFGQHWRDDESSSTSEESDSDTEYRSSSSCDNSLSDTEDKSEAQKDSHGSAVGGAQGQEDSDRFSGKNPLVNSVTPPSSMTPHLLPVSLLPCPPKVTSVLNLDVLLQKPSYDTSTAKHYNGELKFPPIPGGSWGLRSENQ